MSAPQHHCDCRPDRFRKSALGIDWRCAWAERLSTATLFRFTGRIEVATAKLPRHSAAESPSPDRFCFSGHQYTAADWARVATEMIEEIEARGQESSWWAALGFTCGPASALLSESATDEKLRARLTLIRETRGPEHLHRILRRFDPAEARQLNRRDWPRVQRAIEFCLQTGEPILASGLCDLNHRPSPRASGSLR